MRSGELARVAGISTDTLRHYERLGLLPAPGRTAGNYRDYPEEAVGQLRVIRNALAMGLSLQELRRIVCVREEGGAPCHEVRRLAGEKFEAITRQVEELTRYRDRLEKVLKEWDGRLSRTGRTRRARLLEALSEPPGRPPFRFTTRGKTGR